MSPFPPETGRPRPPTVRDGAGKASATVRAVLAMATAAVCFTLMGVVIKIASQTLPLPIIVFFRMLFALLITVPWLVRVGLAGVATRRFGLHVARSLCGALALVCYVYALKVLILADAVALTFTSPLWTIVVSAIALREIVGVRRGLATLAGFAGVLVLVRPAAEVEPAMLVALAGAITTSVAAILVRRLSTTESAMVITFYFFAIATMMAAVPAAISWQTPSQSEFLYLVAIGLLGFLGTFCLTRAYWLTEATVVAPIDFGRLPLAALLGWILFDELPDAWSAVGTLIILASILYITLRARRLAIARAESP